MLAAMSLYPPPVPSQSPPPLHIASFLTNPTASFATLYATAKQRLAALTADPRPVNTSGEASEADVRGQRKHEARVDVFYKWLSVLGAVGFFVGYVIVNGIVQIGVVDELQETGVFAEINFDAFVVFQGSQMQRDAFQMK
ncbi:hypothetical protein BDR26DRAFT_917364 [Obelidium mucronatum]|nr:hypothetical protein BDR26DRAFT_917364 [Obelidium mucronatum]